MNNEVINVNIWDDYYDDEYVPEGETQETYAYLESKLSDDDAKNVLELVKNAITRLMKPEWSLEMRLEYYDSAKVYPNLIGTEYENILFKRWQLEIKDIPHSVLEYIVDTLEQETLSYMDRALSIYSES